MMMLLAATVAIAIVWALVVVAIAMTAVRIGARSEQREKEH